jgi:hypothetical protein
VRQGFEAPPGQDQPSAPYASRRPTNPPQPERQPSPSPARSTFMRFRQWFPRDLPELRRDLAWFQSMAPRAAPEYAGWCAGEIRDLSELIETLEQQQ